MSNLDQQMHDWAVETLESWDIEPAPEDVDYLLGTAMAARQRLHIASRNLGLLAGMPIRRALRRLDRTMAHRRDKVLRREGWIK